MKVFLIFLISIFVIGCDTLVESDTGVKKAEAIVSINADGYTSEQINIVRKLKEDNDIGAIKHLYIISAYSGQTIIYSTVIGKVTSSGKRLTPDRVTSVGGGGGFKFYIGSSACYTDQILGDDGTYGSSIEYLYWWDSKGVSHKHYVSGGQIVHISSQPLVVKGIIINMELVE